MDENTNTITPETGEKTFTQSELDAIISDRLKRERGKIEAKAAATLDEREAELNRREMRLQTLDRLKAEGLPETLADEINAGSKDELDYAINLLRKAVPRGVPGAGNPPPSYRGDNIRQAMGLK